MQKNHPTGKTGKIILGAFLAAAVAAGSSAAVYAYYGSNEKLVNTATAGQDVSEIVETFSAPSLKAGDNIYTKTVSVKNTGSVGDYVRVFMDFSDEKSRDASYLSSDGSTWYKASEYKNHLPSGWTYVSDGTLGGYYYYTKALSPGGSTTALFTKVKTTYGKASDISSYNIIVCEESVQAKNSIGVEYTGTDPWKQAWTAFLG